MAGMVVIRNNAGVEYAVYPHSFEREAHTTYRGFKIVSFEDGTAYEGPKTAAALDKANEPEAEPAPKATKKGGE